MAAMTNTTTIANWANTSVDFNATDLDNVTRDSSDTAVPVPHHRNKLAYVHFSIGTYIFVSNSLVIIAVSKYDYLKTRANIYIVSLAGTDMCVGLTEYSVGLYHHSILYAWFDETALACVGMFSFAFFSVACSMYNTVLIALDRLLYIQKPFFYCRAVTSRKVKRAIGVVWLLAFLWGSVPLYTNTFDPSDSWCTMKAAIPVWYRAYANVPLLFTGAMSTAVMYISIAFTAIQHKKAIMKSMHSTAQASSTDASNMTQAGKQALMNLRSNLQTLKLFGIVFGLLMICWLPYYFIEFTSEFIHIKASIYNYSTALGFLNSGMNFLVYPMYNRKFRRALRSMMCPCMPASTDRRHSDSTMATVSKTGSSKRASGGIAPAPIPPSIPAPIPPPTPAPIPPLIPAPPSDPILPPALAPVPPPTSDQIPTTAPAPILSTTTTLPPPPTQAPIPPQTLATTPLSTPSLLPSPIPASPEPHLGHMDPKPADAIAGPLISASPGSVPVAAPPDSYHGQVSLASPEAAGKSDLVSASARVPEPARVEKSVSTVLALPSVRRLSSSVDVSGSMGDESKSILTGIRPMLNMLVEPFESSVDESASTGVSQENVTIQMQKPGSKQGAFTESKSQSDSESGS